LATSNFAFAENFNSSMVRLKYFDCSLGYFFGLFQFLNGAIKILPGNPKLRLSTKFQFLNGAIKMVSSPMILRYYLNFNSSMVRLKSGRFMWA